MLAFLYIIALHNVQEISSSDFIYSNYASHKKLNTTSLAATKQIVQKNRTRIVANGES